MDPLDSSQLAAETAIDRGEIWLLHWLKNQEHATNHFQLHQLKSHQAQLQSDLLSIITHQSPTLPKPARPIRHLIARILVKLFHRAERRSLFDVIEALLNVANTDPPKNSPDNKLHRVASFYVVGQLMQAHGLHVMSQFSECLMTCLRVIKSSTSPPILKSQALFCLNSSLIVGSKTLSPTENLVKEVLKTLRYALADKTFSIVRGGAECLLTLSDRSLNLISSLSDIEAYLAICFKTLQVVDFDTRRSLSKLIASLLASTQVFGSAVMPTTPAVTSSKSKKNKDDEENDQDPYPTTMTAEEKGKTLLTPEEMLSILNTQYSKPHTSRQARNGLIEAQATLFTLLGTHWVEQFYPEILRHVIFNIGSTKLLHPNPPPSVLRHDTLVSRKLASILLREVISMRLLSEQGQIIAIREISSSIINKWPALMPTHQPPHKTAFVIALNEVAGLLKQVGCATQPIQEVLYNPLIRLLGHPSYSVQISSALCLRTYCLVAPGKLTNTINNVLDLLHKDLSHLGNPGGPSDVNKRAIGHAHGLAGLISLISLRPLYVSFDISSKIMLLAIQLLKESGAHELRISIVEIQVAWILVSALMSLGPNFVRIHLPQLLVLWKNALPKPTAKDHTQLRTDAEWTFLLHLRECTLTSILSFLQRDGEKLLTLDIARRIMTMLSNALAFLSEFEKKYPQRDQEPAVFVGSKLGLGHWELLMRRRVFQCFAALSKISMSSVESIQLNLLDISLGLIGDPEKYTGSSVQAAISASTGSFTSVWDSVDGFSFGVTSLLKENECLNSGDQGSDNSLSNSSDSLMSDWLNRDLTEVAVASVLQQPCIESYEHDSLVICTPQSLDRPFDATNSHPILPAPPVTTATIDAALELFALYFPLVNTNQQATLLDRLCKFNHSTKTDKNLGRKMAILVNSVTALLLATKSCMSSGFLAKSKQQLDPAVVNLMKDILKEALVHSDIRLRSAAAQTFGRACALGGNTFMLSQIQHCVTQVVNNADPDSRSGYALAFSQIYTQVGSLSAGATLKTIVDVLMSLSADPHPSVHFWALRALSEVIHTAGLSYTPFLNSTLGMVVKLYCSDSHEIESGGMGYVNLRASLPSYQNFCKILNAMIGVLGPELSSSGKSKSLIQLLNEELNEEMDEGIQVEVLKSIQHFIIFSIESIDLPKLIQTLRQHLSSNRRTLKVSSINSIYQLVQKNANLMSKLGGDKLVVELFSILDDDPTIEGVRDSIKSWLRQTADSNPSAWIDLCMRIISRTKLVQHSSSVTTEDQAGTSTFIDEESQGLDLDQTTTDRPNLNNRHHHRSRSISSSKSISTVSRWRTQLFALQCLREVFSTVIKNKKFEHFHVQLARSEGLLSSTSTSSTTFKQPPLMFFRVSDLIKMAFTASTANIMEIRLEGLNVLRDVIENFKRSDDIDFDESPLLEQHQAPIAAAITPAFSNDSFPEVLASAIQVCAVFVGSGVVKEIDKMGRILKLLISALDSCKKSEITSLGEMKDFSATASIMIKTAVYAAWAEFQVISIHQAYLSQVIKPYLTVLCPLWVSSLREYARLKSDEDSSSNASASVGTTEGLQVGGREGLYREISLPYYDEAWMKMMKATASLIKAKNPIMLQALDGVDNPTTTTVVETETQPEGKEEHRREPVANFYVLLGLVYEAITSNASIGTEDATSKVSQTMESALYSLEALVQIHVIGSHIITSDHDNRCFIDEICGLCSRLTATESPRVQLLVLRTMVQLANTSAACSPSPIQPLSQADLQLNQCLSVLVQILINSNPGMSSMASSKARKNPRDYAALVIAAFTASADLADRFTSSTREHIYAVLLGLYSESLKDECSFSTISAGVDIVGPTLPALKLIIERGFSCNPSPPTMTTTTTNESAEGLLSKATTSSEREKKNHDDNVLLTKVLNQFILESLENLQDGMKKIQSLTLENKQQNMVNSHHHLFINLSMNLRNNLLACGLIFTTTSPKVPLSRLALVEYCSVLSKLFLNDSTELGATAIHCSKSLILNSKQARFIPSIFQVSLSELLWSYFLFIHKVSSQFIDNHHHLNQEGKGEEDATHSSPDDVHVIKPLDPFLLSFLAEIYKILAGVIRLLPGEKRPQGLAMILPIYLKLIESEQSTTTTSNKSTKDAGVSRMGGVNQVIQLASIDSISFKTAMNSLDDQLKVNLESALRGSLSSTNNHNNHHHNRFHYDGSSPFDRNLNNHLLNPSSSLSSSHPTSTSSNPGKSSPSIELKSFG